MIWAQRKWWCIFVLWGLKLYFHCASGFPKYLRTENLPTENLRFSFVFASKWTTFTQKAEEEFLLYNTLIIIYSDFLWTTFFLSFTSTRNNFDKFVLTGEGAKIEVGWVHQERKAVCLLTRQYLAFLCKEVNKTHRLFTLQLGHLSG